jgi:hypothetical protein
MLFLICDLGINNDLHQVVRNYIQLPDEFTKFSLVSLIWDSLYEMYIILRKEPDHKLKVGHPEGSELSDDYTWEYEASFLDRYKHAAEKYYQLFTLRYGAKELTPYMIKLVDYGGKFL